MLSRPRNTGANCEFACVLRARVGYRQRRCISRQLLLASPNSAYCWCSTSCIHAVVHRTIISAYKAAGLITTPKDKEAG